MGEIMWKTVKETADIMGVSPRTVRRRVKNGVLESKKVKKENGGFKLLVFCPSGQVDTWTSGQVVSEWCPSGGQVEDCPSGDLSKWSETGKNIKEVSSSSPSKKTNRPEIRHLPAELPSKKQEGVTPIAPSCISLPEYNLGSSYDVPRKYEREAQLKAQLCEKIIKMMKQTKLSKTDTWQEILQAFNSKKLVPELRDLYDKDKSLRTLKRWHAAYKKSGRDYAVLARSYILKERGRNLTEVEQNWLLKFLLAPEGKSIGSAIRKIKQMHRAGMIKSEASESTMRRWVNDWKRKHIDIWAMHRKGEKYFAEHINKTLLRDAGMLNVGDIWVADGHVLSPQVIDIETGKPKRMMMVMFFDWASRMPVGASLANTENSAHISAALRNSILNVGYAPRHILIDNGKAFKAKLFHKKSGNHDLENELGGIYERLGCSVTFAKAYNAKSKVIERFFQTFQEDLERYMPAFRGSKVEDKPATLARNEKWLQKIHASQPLTIFEAKQMINFYIFEFYANTPHRGIGNQKPGELLQNAKIDAERYIDPAELNYLMLDRGYMKIQNNGIYFSAIKTWFYHPEMMKHVGQNVLVKYDFFHLTSILVYDYKNQFVCQATERYYQDPMVRLSKNKTNGLALKKELAEIRRNERKARDLATAEKLRIDEATGNLDNLLGNSTEHLFDDSPKLNLPPKKEKKSTDEAVSELYNDDFKADTKEDKNNESEDLKESLGL
jgi:putative transposase